MDTLRLDESLIAELESMAIRTSNGSFISVEDVRRLAERRNTEAQVANALPAPKTMHQARTAAKQFLVEQNGEQGPREPGRVIPANEPPSGVETV